MQPEETPIQNAYDAPLEENGIEASPYDAPLQTSPTEAPTKPQVDAFDMRSAVLIRTARTGESVGEALVNIGQTYLTANQAALTEADTYTRDLQATLPDATAQEMKQAGSAEEAEAVLIAGADAYADAGKAKTPFEVMLDVHDVPPVHPIDVMTNDQEKRSIAAQAEMYRIRLDKMPEGTMEQVRDGAATIADYMTGLDTLDMERIAKFMGMDTDKAGIGPFGTWTWDFNEYWRNYIIAFKQLPVEQQLEEFRNLADYVGEEQTGLQTVLLLEQLLRPGSEFEVDESFFDPANKYFMTLDQVALVGSALTLPFKIIRRVGSSATTHQTLSRLRDVKATYETLMSTADVPAKDIPKILGGNATKEGVVGSLDPVAGTVVLDNVPVVTQREHAVAFNHAIKSLEEMGAIDEQPLSAGQVASVSVISEIMNPESMRARFLFEKAFTTEQMSKAFKDEIIAAHKNGTGTTIDHVVFGTDEFGVVDGSVTLYASDLEKPLSGMMRPDDYGKLHYISGEGDDLVRAELKAEDLRYNEITGEFDVPEGSWRDSMPFNYLLSQRGTALGEQELDAIAAALRLDNTTQQISNEFIAAWHVAISPLGKNPFKKTRSLDKLNDVLTRGDEWVVDGVEVGKDFTRAELRQLFPELTKGEQEAYFNIRHLVDQMHRVKNSEARTIATRKGYKNINIPEIIGDGVVFEGRALNMGKPVDNVQELATKPNVKVYDVTIQHPVDSTSVYKYWNSNDSFKGKKLVKLHNGSRRGLDPANPHKSYEYILVNDNMIEDLPPTILQRKPGYMPRSYERSNYFVRQFDKQGNFVRTLRRFDNSKEAEMFAEELKAGKHGGKGDYTYSAQSEGQFLRMNEDETLFEGVGGLTDSLYTSARAANKIPFGHPDRKLAKLFGRTEKNTGRKHAIYSLQQQMSALSTHLPRNEWRIGLEQKMRNTIKTHLGPEVASAWGGLKSPVPQVGNLEVAAAIETRRMKLAKAAQITDANEQMWQRYTQRLYEWGVKPGQGKIKGAFSEAMWIAHEHDPFKIAKGIGFHTLLGVFRPDQYWVQMQGAAQAAAINILRPDKIARFLDEQRWLNHAMNSSPEQLETIAKSLVGVNPQEFIAKVNLYKKSGLMAGVEVNADFVAASKGYSVSGMAVNKAMQSGLVFYYAGERFNRGFSFLTALDEFQSGKQLFNGKSLKGLSLEKYDDDMLKAVSTRANNLMLNLGPSNQAEWQKGFWGTVTQFWQVNAKLLENVTGVDKAFSGLDRFKIGMTQLGLYGALGIPFGTYVIGAATNQFFETEEDFQKWYGDNKELAKAVMDGFWGTFFLQAFGADISAGRRGSILASIEDLYYKAMEDGTGSPALEVFLGPWGPFASESIDAIKTLHAISGESISQKKVTQAQAEEAFWSIATTVGFGRKMEQAYLLDKYDTFFTGKGNPVWVDDTGATTDATKIMTAMGFTPSRTTRAFTLQEAVRVEQKLEQAALKQMSKEAHTFLVGASASGYGDITDQQIEDLQNRMAAILYSQYPNSQDKRDMLLEKWYKQLASADTVEDKAIDGFIKEAIKGGFDDFWDRMDLNKLEGMLEVKKRMGEE